MHILSILKKLKKCVLKKWRRYRGNGPSKVRNHWRREPVPTQASAASGGWRRTRPPKSQRVLRTAPALAEKFEAPNFSQIFQPNHQTSEGSFSAVSTPIFASKFSFCSVFRNLQDCHTFAPLEAQNLRKFSSNIFIFLLKFQQKSRFFSNFEFSSNFVPISMKLFQNFDE